MKNFVLMKEKSFQQKTLFSWKKVVFCEENFAFMKIYLCLQMPMAEALYSNPFTDLDGGTLSMAAQMRKSRSVDASVFDLAEAMNPNFGSGANNSGDLQPAGLSMSSSSANNYVRGSAAAAVNGHGGSSSTLVRNAKSEYDLSAINGPGLCLKVRNGDGDEIVVLASSGDILYHCVKGCQIESNRISLSNRMFLQRSNRIECRSN
jgi:hypothetical protein